MLPVLWKRKQPSVDSTQPSGQPVGAVVGELVGAAVGAPVGAAVGAPVGAAVGAHVGAAVGAPVGAGGAHDDGYAGAWGAEKANWSNRNWGIALVIILNSMNVQSGSVIFKLNDAYTCEVGSYSQHER